MKSPTKYYKELQRALKKARLITGGVNMVSCATDLQHLKLQSYILLSHAAFEQYLEDLGRAAALTARLKFTNEGVISKTLISLISAKLIDELPEKSKNKAIADLVSSLEVFSSEAYNRYLNVVSSNHGIVAENQNKLLTPIGVAPEAVDIALRNGLDAFGRKRGDVAHKFRVQTTSTLTSVETDIRHLREGILAYDKAVCDALISQRI